MVRSLILIPLAVLLVAVLGYTYCRMAGWNPHLPDLVAAAVVMTLAGEFALAPGLLMRGSPKSTVSQAGFGGTVIHMLLAVLLAALAWMLGRIEDQSAFVYWLLVFYWISLIGLVVAVLRMVREAPTDAPPAGAAKSPPADGPGSK